MTTNQNPLPSLSSDIISKLNSFINERNWEQFHSPKNLLLALVGEVGELAEHFQWLSEDKSLNLTEDKLNSISEELADIFIYTLLLSQKLNINLEEATRGKIEVNDCKYPVSKSKGNSQKYTDY